MRMRHDGAGWWTAPLIALVTVVTNGVGCEKPPAPPAPPPPVVTVSQPLDREVMEWDEYTGTLEAVDKVEVRARVNGYLQSVNFKEGAIVNKGDLLFVIDPRPYEAELARTQGEVARAQARLDLAQTEFKRTQSLVPSAAASELELEERKANLAEAKAALAVAQAAVKSAQLNVEFTHVRAEISGRISKFNMTPGNLITGGEAAESPLLTTITSLDPMYCYVDADERSVLKYRRLMRENKRPSAQAGAQVVAKMALEDEKDFVHVGHIDFVDNQVDRRTGTLRARGVFRNPNNVMTPGFFARMRVPGAEPYRTLLVAEAAIQHDQSTKYVLTVDAENTVHVTPVETGTLFGNLRAIKSGLKGDEQIVVNGILRARPGAKVEPKPGPMPGAQDADTLATTRVVEPVPGSATTRPTTEPAAPATGPAQPAMRPSTEDRAAVRPSSPQADAAPAGGSAKNASQVIGVVVGVAEVAR